MPLQNTQQPPWPPPHSSHHHTLNFNNTYQSGNHANFLSEILAFTPLCSCSHKTKLNTIKIQFVVYVAIEITYQATPACYNHLHGQQAA